MQITPPPRPQHSPLLCPTVTSVPTQWHHSVCGHHHLRHLTGTGQPCLIGLKQSPWFFKVLSGSPTQTPRALSETKLPPGRLLESRLGSPCLSFSLPVRRWIFLVLFHNLFLTQLTPRPSTHAVWIRAPPGSPRPHGSPLASPVSLQVPFRQPKRCFNNIYLHKSNDFSLKTC